MSIAFTFPGQGSQAVGMGKALYDDFVAARDVFDEVDEALETKLSQLIFEGAEADLMLTANAQPALMAVSMAILRVMECQGFVLQEKVSYVAGHSLGEYCALCAAGMFSLTDTARLLRLRGQAMQDAVPVGIGAMAAIIGLEETQVASLCEEAAGLGVCQIANDNGGGQWVISGQREAIEKACALATAQGAKRALLLPVSAPFHSSLMQPAAVAMQEALKEVGKVDPQVPLIANVLAEPVQDSSQIADLLVKQVTGRVRWRESVGWLAGMGGVDTIYEIGNGRVLTGLSRRIAKDIRAICVTNADDIEAALKEL